MMHHAQIAQRAFNTPLMVDPAKALAFLSGLGPRITGQEITFHGLEVDTADQASATLPASASLFGNDLAQRHQRNGTQPFAMVNGIAVIEVAGTLVHRGAWIGQSSGLTSYEGIAAQLQAALADPGVRGIALDIDSFGGEVAGAFDLADRIRAARAQKPIHAFVAEHALSAGYVLASQADHIILPRTGAVGSIGVVALHTDMSGALNQKGISVTLIHAGAHKVDANPYQPLPELVHDQMQRELEVVRFLFAETVAAGRGDRLTHTAALATEAAVFRGADAIAAGLADELADPVTAFHAFAAAPHGTTSPSRKGPQMTTMPNDTPNPAPVATPPAVMPAVAAAPEPPAGELAGVSMGEIEQATKKLTTRLSEAAAGSGSAVGALQRLNLTATELQALPLDQRIVAIQQALNRFVPEAERAAVASDLFGDKAALAFLRIDPATLREAAQDVRDFGVAVIATDAAQIERTGDAIAKLSLIWLGLTNRLTAAVAPALETIANSLADMARSTGPIGIAINALFDNIGRLTTYAATFATLMAGRWVAGLAAAALSVRGLATGLVILRGALIRTGIGALIVGAGELVFQFTRLVAGAGGFGAAIGLLKDLALEVWDRIGLGAASAWSKIEASWAGLQATIYGAMQSSVEAVTSFGNSAAGIFKGAYEAVKAIWGQLPGAIGDFAFQAANGLIGGVEAMLNGVVTRINNFINGLNAALDLLPDWAVGEGGVRIGTLDPVALGRIDNPFAGSAAAAGGAAAEAFSAAMAQTYVTTPDLGLTGMAEEATARAEAYREASGMLADAAARPIQSWQALQDAVAGAGTEGEAALDGAADAADRLDESVTEAGRAAGGAGAAAAAGAEVAKTGWEAAVATLADYAAKARDIGGDVGNALVSAFTSAENAVGEFVKTGKLDFRDLVTSMIADLAKLAARRFILGPIANALSGALSGAGGIFANILHGGGMVGAPGPGRMVPALAFANAPRMHAGGWAGIKPDEVPAILQRGERVLSRREAAGHGQGQRAAPNVSVTINARDAESFRQSRTQVAADIARAVSLGRRGM